MTPDILQNAGDFYVYEMRINVHNKKTGVIDAYYDMRNLYIELNFYQNIFIPYMYGDLSIIDATGFWEKIKHKLLSVYIKIKTPRPC